MVGGKPLDGFAKSMDAFEKASDGFWESIWCHNSPDALRRVLASAPLRLRTYGAFVAWVSRPLRAVRFRFRFPEGRLTHAERDTRLHLVAHEENSKKF